MLEVPTQNVLNRNIDLKKLIIKENMKEVLAVSKRFIATRLPMKKSPEKKELMKASIKYIKNIPRQPKIPPLSEMRPFRVSVEGNIGAGKTTVINYFSQFPNVEAYSEPIDWWRNLDGHNLLDLLYKDINKWYNVFQKYVQLTRVQMQTMPPKYASTTTQIFERSIQNNRYTFVEHAYAAGYLKNPEYIVFNEWYEWFRDNIDIDIDFIVYLRTTPEIVFERMKNRGREEESSVPFEYLKELHEFHEKWLVGPERQINSDKLLIIDANLSLESVLQQCESNKNKIISKEMVMKTAENKMF